MVLLNGPVQNAWFCLMDRYRNVCVWFMARNCRFPKVGTLCCQRGNHRLPLQGTAGSQRMELLVPNLGTRGYHCKQLPVPKGWNSLLPTWEPQVTIAKNCRFPEDGTLGSCTVPNLGTRGYHCKQLPVPRGWNSRFPTWEPQVTIAEKLPVPRGWNSLLPTWEPQVTIARNCRFPEDGTLGSQPGNQRLPLQATAGSQRLELSVANVGTTGYHCKELPVPRGWNSWFLYSFQPGNQRLPLQATAGSQRLELTLPNLGTTGYHCKELPVPRGWNSWFPTWEPHFTIARNCRFPEVGTLGSQPGNHGLPLQATVKMI